MDIIREFGGGVCRMAVNSARCYDPGATLGIGLAALALIAALLLGAYFSFSR
ncbi:MAG: hypothetical protein U1E62_11595 [Alsobacter sp.]